MTKKNIINYVLVPIICACISLILGMIFDDVFIGTSMLFVGLLNAYYMAIGKWTNYIFGILFSIIYAFVCYSNGLYGFLIFTILVYTPIQIIGLINWIKNKQDNTVLTKSLSFLSGMGLTVLVIVCSFLLGFLLTLIPGQNLAFLDSSSQIINLCGVFLMSIRHREAWYVWLMNNTVDLIIWIINISNNSTYSQMAFIVSVMYFVMNIISLILWIKIEKKQKEKVA